MLLPSAHRRGLDAGRKPENQRRIKDAVSSLRGKKNGGTAASGRGTGRA
jgi:hypothetical protein